jgi:hypothetical protein
MSVKAIDEGAGRRYYTEIPNLVLTLNLSPFELALYVHLKRTAGDDGRCWKSTPTLAKETGMSAGMITKAKEGLVKKREELAGRALIVVTEEPNPHGGRARHVVTLTDVWPENVARFSRPSSQDELASSPHELANSPHELASSPHEIKKNSGEEEHKRKVGSRASAPSPDSVISEMLSSPAYQGIDVRREFFKMQAWCEAHGKEATRRRFVNWLNRVDVIPARAGPPPAESAAAKSRRLEEELNARQRRTA